MHGCYKVLVVDDDPQVGRAVQRAFVDDDRFEVTLSAGPQLALIQMRNRLFDLVLCDLKMPQMNGLELLARVRDEFPSCVRLLFSGELDVRTAEEAIASGIVYRFVLKPWDNDELRTTMGRALEHRDALMDNQRILEQVKQFAEQLSQLEVEFPGLTQRFVELGRSTRVVRHPRAVEAVERVLAHNARLLSGKAAG